MNEFPVIGEQEQMIMKGGYTFSEMEQMIDAGTWTGGQVDGIGYVGPVSMAYGTDLSTFWKRLKYRASFFNNCQECREENEMLNSAGHPITDYTEGGTGAGVEVLFEHFIYGGMMNLDIRGYFT